ncbi:hypothetical protein ACT16_22850 [Mycobacterium heckeshornense]|nr:hypothetical protein ACT16_22850 [Mycobacterium heckeshornense]
MGQLAVDLGSVAVLHTIFGDLDRLGNNRVFVLCIGRWSWAGRTMGGQMASLLETCTMVNRTFRIVASRVAHRTAMVDDADPSTPTMTPGCVPRLDFTVLPWGAPGVTTMF